MIRSARAPFLPLLIAILSVVTACKKGGVFSSDEGACAEVHKFKNDFYSVLINPDPKKGCKMGSQVGFSLEERLALLKERQRQIQKKLAEFSQCLAVADELGKKIDAATVKSACNGNPECASDMGWALFLRGLQGSGIMSRRYFGIDDGYAEGYDALHTIYSKIGVPEDAIESGRMATEEERVAHQALLHAGSNEECRNAILEKYRSTFDNMVFEQYNPETDSSTGYTASGAPVSGVTRLILKQISCQYGKGAEPAQVCKTLSDPF